MPRATLCWHWRAPSVSMCLLPCPVSFPCTEGSDDRYHIPPVQHPAFNAEQNFALNPSVEGDEQGRERGRLRLLRFLYPLDAALKGADDGRGF